MLPFSSVKWIKKTAGNFEQVKILIFREASIQEIVAVLRKKLSMEIIKLNLKYTGNVGDSELGTLYSEFQQKWSDLVEQRYFFYS